MRFRQLSDLFYGWGWEIKHEHYVAFCDYLKEMLKRKRVMVIYNGEFIDAVIMFYLTHDYTKLYKKGTWEIAHDDENGSQIYIDKMVCNKYTKELRVALQSAIEDNFPQVTMGVYHRAPKDKCFKISRRMAHV